jgi:hypothetical protein
VPAHEPVDVDTGGGQCQAGGQPGLAGALARHHHAVRGRVQQVAAVVLDEDGGVGPVRFGVHVQDLPGGHAAAPVPYGVGDGTDQLAEAVGSGGGLVEVADGCTHDGTLAVVSPGPGGVPGARVRPR